MTLFSAATEACFCDQRHRTGHINVDGKLCSWLKQSCSVWAVSRQKGSQAVQIIAEMI